MLEKNPAQIKLHILCAEIDKFEKSIIFQDSHIYM